jgi:histidinol-phosphate phosphatase family protein
MDISFDSLGFLQDYTGQVQATLASLPIEGLARIVAILHEARLCRAQVFLCGNGGSAATASHFVNDLNKGANAQGYPRFRAIGLNDNVPLLMAWSNDSAYDVGLMEPLRNLGRPGDVLIAISCSGNSPNVVAAARYAREIGMKVVALTGGPGGALAPLADAPLVVPNGCTEQVEDVHMFLDHILVSALRAKAQAEPVPSLLLSDGRGATPQSPALSAAVTRRAAIFLDRDGVINANRPDHVKSWDEFELLPGATEALRALAQLPLPVIAVTNQSVINRGLASYAVVESIHLRLMRAVAEQGGRLDAVIWCPHGPAEGCACRKPGIGMLTYASQALRLDLSRSYLVGDAVTDMQAAQAAGAQGLLVRTGRGPAQVAEVDQGANTPYRVVDDLAAAASCIRADWLSRRQPHG